MLTSVGEATQCRFFSSDHGLVPDLGLSRFLIGVRDVNHDVFLRRTHAEHPRLESMVSLLDLVD